MEDTGLPVCTVPGCITEQYIQHVGLCRLHYRRREQFGDTEASTRVAGCGHDVPIRRGRPRAACERCSPPRAKRPDSAACVACGEPIEVTSGRPGPTRMVCSTRCRNWRQAHPDEPLPPFRGCRWCGTDIRTRPSREYCSSLCGRIDRGETLYGPRQQLICANPECAKPFLKYYPRQNCCSEKCGKRRWALQAKADGYVMPRRPWDDRRRDAYHRRRAQQRATSSGAPVLRDAIGDRDRWKCGACGKKVNRNLAYPDPRSPSMDHVIPLSKGGPHTPENVRITHLECNLAKGNRGGGEQLLLVG